MSKEIQYEGETYYPLAAGVIIEEGDRCRYGEVLRLSDRVGRKVYDGGYLPIYYRKKEKAWQQEIQYDGETYCLLESGATIEGGDLYVNPRLWFLLVLSLRHHRFHRDLWGRYYRKKEKKMQQQKIRIHDGKVYKQLKAGIKLLPSDRCISRDGTPAKPAAEEASSWGGHYRPIGTLKEIDVAEEYLAEQTEDHWAAIKCLVLIARSKANSPVAAANKVLKQILPNQVRKQLLGER